MSSFQSRSYQENTKGKGVDKLIRDGQDDTQVLANLRAQHPNDPSLVSKLFSQYEEKMSRIKRKAQKFATLILTRYSNLGPKKLLEKARKYQKKYGFSDDEFSAFISVALSDKAFAGSNMYNVPNTPLASTLGHTTEALGKMNVPANELSVVQEILNMFQEHQSLHYQVVVQSLLHDNCEPTALIGDFDPRRDNALSFIHPVVAALFLPRFKYIDEHMIIGNIAEIVASRFKNIPIKTQPNYELYYDMITDPNEVACQGDRDSPISDLRNRVALQCSLWKVVRDLRQGKYYSPEAAGFDLALNNCRSGFFDTPDLAFTRDEGTIIRRLFGAFSLRPTVVSISSFSTTTGAIGFQAGMTGNVPVSSLAMTQVTTIPIINIRLPLNIQAGMGPTQGASVVLQDQLNSPDWYVENKMIVPKTKSVIYSRDIAVFYVNRRYNQINFQRLTSPYALQTLPTATTGFEQINETSINALAPINIGGATFELTSVVCVDTVNLADKGNFTSTNEFTNTNIIIGSYAYVKCNGQSVTDWIVYNPREATRTQLNGSTIQRAAPVYKSDPVNAEKRGTIFIFEKKIGAFKPTEQTFVAPPKIEAKTADAAATGDAGVSTGYGAAGVSPAAGLTGAKTGGFKW